MKASAALAVYSFLTLLGWIGQGVGVPLFLATFIDADGNFTTGPYFVVLFCSIVFNFVYWPLVAVVAFDRRQASTGARLSAEIAYLRTRRGVFKILAIGVCNSLNGLLQVYASSTTRVPGALQPILLQSTLLFTVVGSKLFLRKAYSKGQLGAVALVAVGVATALAPFLAELAKGGASTQLQSGPLWPLVLVLGCAPNAAMVLVQESLFDDVPAFSVPFLLGLTSLVQAVAVGLLFWTDLVPSFGTSASASVFGSHLTGGFECFFAPASSANPTRCGLCAPLGLVFVFSYAAAYFFGGKVTQHASANLQSLLATLGFFMQIYFWLALPTVNSWAGGKSYSTLEIATTSVALLPIGGGTFLFRWCEPSTARERALHNHGAAPEGGRLANTLLPTVNEEARQ